MENNGLEKSKKFFNFVRSDFTRGRNEVLFCSQVVKEATYSYVFYFEEKINVEWNK